MTATLPLPLHLPARPSDLLIEPCAGSAALTLSLLGADAGLMPYQGSKWRLRRELHAVLAEAGALGRPRRVVLTDTGPWGWVWPLLLVDPRTRSAVADALEELGSREPRELYDELQGAAYLRDPVGAAQFLFLQRISYCGKAVSGLGGRWCSPGFNPVSAYGVPETERFGWVRPQVPSLVERIRALPTVELLEADPGGPAVVYLDPPYAGTTGYPDGSMSRAEVVALALRHAREGRTVLVSEAEPVGELVAAGWRVTELTAGVEGRFGKQDEWVTWWPGEGA